MAFRFGLETVLKQRKRVEEVAQREFAEAQHAVDEILRRIEEMYRRMDEIREDIRRAQHAGRSDGVAQITAMEEFLSGLRRLIDETRLEARRLMSDAEEKQEALISAARERKILVKLKERRLEEYKTWLARLEAKEADDMTMIRQIWGKK